MTSSDPAILTYDQRVKLEITDLTSSRFGYSFIMSISTSIFLPGWGQPQGSSGAVIWV
jgi:hypothetical protein